MLCFECNELLLNRKMYILRPLRLKPISIDNHNVRLHIIMVDYELAIHNAIRSVLSYTFPVKQPATFAEKTFLPVFLENLEDIC